ncbi:MAG: DUF2267 domain-containing protein [Hyphomicrobium sp.]
MTVPAPVSHAVEKMQEWLKELRDKGGLADEAAAYSVLRSVLHRLRDRLTVEEAVDLSAQLPLMVRGLYFEGWRPSKVPSKVRTAREFVDELSEELLPYTYPIEQAVRDVFALLAHHCDPNEISNVINQLPAGIKKLWPETALPNRYKTS